MSCEKTADPAHFCDVPYQQLSKDINEWKTHYDLVCRFTEKINRCFGLPLLITSAIDFAVPIIIEFNNLIAHQFTSPRYYLQFLHTVLRFLSILVASYHLEYQVQVAYWSLMDL